MSKLTLEQVLVILDKRAAQFAKLGEGQAAWELRESWNAIDAALKVQGEPVNSERVAQLIAHRACCGTEHDPANGKLHGYCVVCGVPWPCEYAGKPPADDRPTWEEVRAMLIRGYADGYEDHQCDISGRPGKSADRIIAEFRKG